MNVLIAGGSGFIGSHIIDKLVAANCFVGILDQKPPTDFLVTSSGYTFFQSSLPFIPEEVFHTRWDVIINLAAMSSVAECENDLIKAFHVNTAGSKSLLDLAYKSKARFIFASSAAVYSESHEPCGVFSPTAPLSVYGESKLLAERDIFHYGNCYDVPVFVFRFFNIFGPNQFLYNPQAVVPSFLSAALDSQPIMVNSSAGYVRDFVPVSVVADAIVSAVFSNIALRQPIPVCSGVPRSIVSLAETIAAFPEVSSKVVLRESNDSVSLQYSLGDPSYFNSIFKSIVFPSFEDYLFSCFSYMKSSRLSE